MGTLDTIVQKFNIDLRWKSPIMVPNMSRQLMAETLHELGFTTGAEIGVAEGVHAEILCQNIPGLKLYCIDAWQHYHGYLDYMTAKLEGFERKARARLAPYNCEIIKAFSADAVKGFPDKSLDFVYIDGAHDFKNVAVDICDWVEKVRPDGIIYGHDYTRSKHSGRWLCHVKDVVNAYTYSHGIVPWFVLNTTAAREGSYSWLWVVK